MIRIIREPQVRKPTQLKLSTPPPTHPIPKKVSDISHIQKKPVPPPQIIHDIHKKHTPGLFERFWVWLGAPAQPDNDNTPVDIHRMPIVKPSELENHPPKIVIEEAAPKLVIKNESVKPVPVISDVKITIKEAPKPAPAPLPTPVPPPKPQIVIEEKKSEPIPPPKIQEIKIEIPKPELVPPAPAPVLEPKPLPEFPHIEIELPPEPVPAPAPVKPIEIKPEPQQITPPAPVAEPVPAKKLPLKKDDAQSGWDKFIEKIGMIGVGQEKEYIIENLSVLLSAGNDIITTLGSIRSELKSRTLKNILARVESEVSAGISLSKALENSGIFPKHISALIAIGESSGKMEENLQVVVTQQAKDRMFFSKIRSAMIYPGLVLGLMVSVGTGVAWFILPRIASIFSQLKIKVPLITEIIIDIGKFLENYGAIVVPLVVIFMITTVFFLFFYEKTKFLGQAMLFQIPGIKALIRELELAHIGFILGTLLSAGVPIVTALDALTDAVGFYKYKKLYIHLKNRIELGDQFKDGFASFPNLSELIPNPVQQIITAGEQSGHLEGSFKKIADIYEQKTEITTKNISVLLEPILLVIVWIAVVLVALGVILPIYGLIGGLEV